MITATVLALALTLQALSPPPGTGRLVRRVSSLALSAGRLSTLGM